MNRAVQNLKMEYADVAGWPMMQGGRPVAFSAKSRRVWLKAGKRIAELTTEAGDRWATVDCPVRGTQHSKSKVLKDQLK